MQNVPLLQNKGDINVVFSNRNFQAAAAISEHVGVLANGYYAKNFSHTVYNSPSYQGEAGLGYFTAIDDQFNFEVYGGGGLGRTQHSDFSFGYIHYMSAYNHLFIQPAIGIKNDKLDVAFSTRFTGLKYNGLNDNSSSLQQRYLYELQHIDRTLYTFIEPAFTFRFGYKWIKLHTQYIVSMKLNKTELDYQHFNVNLGLNINIAEAFVTKNQP